MGIMSIKYIFHIATNAVNHKPQRGGAMKKIQAIR